MRNAQMARHRLSVFESKDSRYHGNQSLIDANFHVIWNKQPRHSFSYVLSHTYGFCLQMVTMVTLSVGGNVNPSLSR